MKVQLWFGFVGFGGKKSLERMDSGKSICPLGYGVKIKLTRLGSREKRLNVFRARKTTLGDLGKLFCEMV